MKRIIILKVQNNSLTGLAEQITVGFCNDDGVFTEWKLLPSEMFDQRIILEKGMELKLTPINLL